jgi:hypothetical protein
MLENITETCFPQSLQMKLKKYSVVKNSYAGIHVYLKSTNSIIPMARLAFGSMDIYPKMNLENPNSTVMSRTTGITILKLRI